uniref:GYF domain-containing protein n=1 Tax=Steinernema glaseri TaxID=37863 RepID=A0A1I7ZXD9_9BILA
MATKRVTMATKRVTFAGPSEDDGDDVYPDEEYSASMAKKRKAIRTGTVEDDEDTFEADAEKRKDDSKSYHTLDSDEEDNVKYDKLDMRKIHGQEEGTEEYEGDVKITAFNMKEDMEDGHFDSAGNFIFNKTEEIRDAGNFIFNKTEEIRDGWLDNIDWTQVKRRAGKHWLKEEKEYADDTTGFDKTQMKAIYEKLLGVLQPKESILRAIKRIGAANKLSAAEERKRRWAAKKAGKEVESDETKMVKEEKEYADDTTGFDKTQMKAIYEKLLGVLQPKESILRAIKRIGAANSKILLSLS